MKVLNHPTEAPAAPIVPVHAPLTKTNKGTTSKPPGPQLAYSTLTFSGATSQTLACDSPTLSLPRATSPQHTPNTTTSQLQDDHGQRSSLLKFPGLNQQYPTVAIQHFSQPPLLPLHQAFTPFQRAYPPPEFLMPPIPPAQTVYFAKDVFPSTTVGHSRLDPPSSHQQTE